MNPLQVAHNEAQHNDTFLKNAFARYLGNSEHPRGKVLSAYRGGRNDMQRALKSNRFMLPNEVNAVLTNMRAEIGAIGSEVIGLSAHRGATSGQSQVEAYQQAGMDFMSANDIADVSGLTASFTSIFDQQAQSIRGMIASGNYDVTRIVGDEARLGMLQPNPLVVGTSELITAALVAGLLAWWIGRDKQPRRGFEQFRKQAIAVIDEKTTDCCLQVNGQIKDFDADFHLTGTPRFADYQQWSPFHYHCRTTIALYSKDFDFGITAQIEDSARREITRRRP